MTDNLICICAWKEVCKGEVLEWNFELDWQFQPYFSGKIPLCELHYKYFSKNPYELPEYVKKVKSGKQDKGEAENVMK